MSNGVFSRHHKGGGFQHDEAYKDFADKLTDIKNMLEED